MCKDLVKGWLMLGNHSLKIKDALSVDNADKIKNSCRHRFYMQSKKKVYLTRREMEIARHLLHALTYKHIGLQLGISERTIECHVKRMRNKLSCKNRYELMRELQLNTELFDVKKVLMANPMLQ